MKQFNNITINYWDNAFTAIRSCDVIRGVNMFRGLNYSRNHVLGKLKQIITRSIKKLK